MWHIGATSKRSHGNKVADTDPSKRRSTEQLDGDSSCKRLAATETETASAAMEAAMATAAGATDMVNTRTAAVPTQAEAE